jgi:hypothetical protein
MATSLYFVDSTPIIWGSGLPTANYQLNLQGVDSGVIRGPAHQGQKGDLGANRPEQYSVHFQTACQLAPTAGTTVWLYWGQSPSGQNATMNPANLTGNDGVYNGYSSDGVTAIRQLDLIGVMSMSAVTGIQHMVFSPFSPLDRYGMPVVYMNDVNVQLSSGVANHFVTLYPITDQGQ